MAGISQRFAAVRGLSPLPASEALKLDIRDVEKGGYVEIKGATFQVVDVFKYLEVKWSNFKKKKSDYWVYELQLFNVKTGGTCFVEWEVDDELEVCETITEVKLLDIKHNGSPVTTRALAEIAEAEYGEVVCNGTTYHYSEDDTWAALFYRDEEEEPLKVKMYEFHSDGGEFLTVEAWDDEDSKPEREAFTSREIASNSVKVIQCQPTPTDRKEGNQ